MYTHTYIHTHIYIYIHIYIYTHTAGEGLINNKNLFLTVLEAGSSRSECSIVRPGKGLLED